MELAKNYKQLNDELITKLHKYNKDDVMYEYYLSKILNLNEPLIQQYAKKFRHRNDHEDILQELRLSLVTSLDTFDLSQDISFSTYATGAMNIAVNRYFENLPLVKGNENKFWKLINAKKILEEKGIFTPSHQQLAEVAQLDEIQEQYIINIVNQDAPISSTDMMVRNLNGERNTLLIDLIPDNFNLIEEYNKLESFENLHRAVNQLSIVQRNVINALYLQGDKQNSIANELQFTQQFISLVVKTALKNLKVLLSEDMLQLASLKEKLTLSCAKNKLNTSTVNTILHKLDINTPKLMQMVDLTLFTNSTQTSPIIKIGDYKFAPEITTFDKEVLCKTIKSITTSKKLSQEQTTQLTELRNKMRKYKYKATAKGCDEKTI